MAVEPHIRQLPACLEGRAELADLREALRADVIVILVAHDAFREMSLAPQEDRIVIDCVNIQNN